MGAARWHYDLRKDRVIGDEPGNTRRVLPGTVDASIAEYLTLTRAGCLGLTTSMS